MPGGCTVEAACNYDVDAAYNDGSCEFSTCQVYGCNVEAACNYDEDATVNDGSCDFATCFSNDINGCTNPIGMQLRWQCNSQRRQL